MAKDGRTSPDRVWVKAQVFNKWNQGEDIILPDEFGVNWQIKDGAKARLPLAIVSALEDSITHRHIIDKKTREIRLEPRYVIVKFPDDAIIDGIKSNDTENAVVDEAITTAKKRGANIPKGGKTAKKKDKKLDSANAEQ